MDTHNITKAYLSVSSPGVYLNVPSQNATQKAIALSRQINDYASDLKAQYPERFGFFASLPLPDIEAALKEIDYCFTKLCPKPDGVVLMSNFYGMYLGDPALDPVYKALNSHGVTIFEHPTTPCTEYNSLQFHTNSTAPPITQKQWQAMNRPIASRQFAAPTLDFPFDTARTFADLFMSKIPSRFPRIKWIMPHGGGGLMSTIDRVVSYSFLYPGHNMTESIMKETLSTNFYFDLAGPWPVNFAISTLLRWVDHTRIMWGSDTPFTPWAVSEKLIEAFDRDIEQVFNDVGANEKIQSIGAGNAEDLFGV